MPRVYIIEYIIEGRARGGGGGGGGRATCVHAIHMRQPDISVSAAISPEQARLKFTDCTSNWISSPKLAEGSTRSHRPFSLCPSPLTLLLPLFRISRGRCYRLQGEHEHREINTLLFRAGLHSYSVTGNGCFLCFLVILDVCIFGTFEGDAFTRLIIFSEFILEPTSLR